MTDPALAARPVSHAAPAGTATCDFESVYEGYADFVWRNARRLGIAEDALDDVVQDVFVVAHRRFSSLRPDALRSWLFGILVRVVRNHRRGRRRKGLDRFSSSSGSDPEQVPASSRSSPLATAELSNAARILHTLLLELSEERREVFVLAEIEEIPVAEISAALGINANTIQSRLRAARKDFNDAVVRHRARDEWRLR